jgi:hypothetical protein
VERVLLVLGDDTVRIQEQNRSVKRYRTIIAADRQPTVDMIPYKTARPAEWISLPPNNNALTLEANASVEGPRSRVPLKPFKSGSHLIPTKALVFVSPFSSAHVPHTFCISSAHVPHAFRIFSVQQ